MLFNQIHQVDFGQEHVPLKRGKGSNKPLRAPLQDTETIHVPFCHFCISSSILTLVVNLNFQRQK